MFEKETILFLLVYGMPYRGRLTNNYTMLPKHNASVQMQTRLQTYVLNDFISLISPNKTICFYLFISKKSTWGKKAFLDNQKLLCAF